MPARRVALLRAINVGGTGRLAMSDLRTLAEEEGYEGVQTLGASGNLVYAPVPGRTPAADASRFAAAVSAQVGRETPVIVRTAAQLRALVDAEPFATVPPRVPQKWRFVVFLQAPSRKPLPEMPEGSPCAWALRRSAEVCYAVVEPTRVALDVVKRLERALAVQGTARNWNVVRKLVAMTEAAEN